MPHAQKMPRRVQGIPIGDRGRPGGKALQVVAKSCARALPPETHFVELVRPRFGEIEARTNRKVRKPRIVFDAAEPFFRYGEKDLTVAHNTCGRVVHLGIVDAKSHHRGSAFAARGTVRITLLSGELRPLRRSQS